MTGILQSAVHKSRRRPLAACVASIFALSAPAAATASTWTVASCDGDSNSGVIATKSGTLRFAIQHADDGDIVELGALSCPSSRISLTTGSYIPVLQPSLTIRGPAGSVLIIDGSTLPGGDIAYSNIFYHTGNGTLTIQDLALTGGHINHYNASAKGGCVYSKGNVVLDHASVSSCSANSVHYSALGAGVYALGNVDLTDSTVSGNVGTGAANAIGGGVYAKGKLTLQVSVLSGNKANGSSSRGGGAHANGDFSAAYSTISGNTAYGFSYGGGLELRGASNTISSSTISGNTSNSAVGGIDVASLGAAGGIFQISNSTISENHALNDWAGGLRVDSRTAKFYNSTIAFNTAKFGGPAEATGVMFVGDFNTIAATMESTLISNNTHDAIEFDVGEFPVGTVTVNGGLTAIPANNLIRVTSIGALPTDTKPDCPLLGRLRDNGGLTWTNALLSHSPAIDAGNAFVVGSYDQRGKAAVNGTLDYLRVSGPAGQPGPKADIGAHEVQQNDIVFDTDFEGCP